MLGSQKAESHARRADRPSHHRTERRILAQLPGQLDDLDATRTDMVLPGIDILLFMCISKTVKMLSSLPASLFLTVPGTISEKLLHHLERNRPPWLLGGPALNGPSEATTLQASPRLLAASQRCAASCWRARASRRRQKGVAGQSRENPPGFSFTKEYQRVTGDQTKKSILQWANMRFCVFAAAFRKITKASIS